MSTLDPLSDHVDDSAIWWIREFFLFGCLQGVVGVWKIWVMRRRWWKNLHLLMVLVSVVGWMLDLLVVVGLLVMVCVRDDPLVVGWLCSGHSIPGGLGLWTIPCWVCTVFTVKQAVESVWLLCSSVASSSCVVAAALGVVFLTIGGLSGWVLIGYIMHLLMSAIVSAGVWLRWPGPGSARLRRVLGLPLKFNLALMELLRPSVLLK
jgi:hypothetical protein